MNQIDLMKPTAGRLAEQSGMAGAMPSPSDAAGQTPQTQASGRFTQPGPGVAQVNLDAFNPEAISSQQAVILRQLAGQANSAGAQDAAYSAAMQGISPDELASMKQEKDNAAKAMQLAQESLHMSEQQYDDILKQILQEGQNTPQRPQEGQLEAPNLWQAGASILAGFIDPSRRAEYASIPLGYQINKQKQDYAKAQGDYKGQMDDHNRKMDLLETVAKYRGQRLTMLQNAALDAERRQDKAQSQMIAGAQKVESRLAKASSAELGSILQQANKFYEAAGMKGLMVPPEEIQAQVEAKKAEEEQELEDKAWAKEYPNIVRNLTAIGSGTPASRKTAAELLKASVERWPSKFTPEAVLKISEALSGAGDPTTKEVLDESRTKEADSRTAVNKIKAKYLPQQFQDNHDKARKTIQNMQSVIDHRKATGEGDSTSSEERIAANQALQSIDRAMDDYRLVAQNARERLNKINDYIVGDPKLADKFKDEKAELEDTIREAQAGFEQMQKESKEVRDYLKSKATAKEEGWLDKAGNAVRGFIGMSGTKRKPSKKGEIPPMGVDIPKDMKAKGWQ